MQLDLRLKKRLFRKYYTDDRFLHATLYPSDFKFRHFRVELFSNGRRRFERIKDVFQDESKLKRRLSKIVPKNAYFTPVKWLSPIYVSKTKSIQDVMLSVPLFFDIDFKHLNPPSFENAKNTTSHLCNYIVNEFKRSPDQIIFSGKQGFHIHYEQWDERDLFKLSPEHRINEFIKNRQGLVKKLHSNNILVDPTVTPDPYRIIKISDTLHGDTGLVASKVDKVCDFNPIKESTFFSLDEYEEIFNLDLTIYEI